MDHNLDQKLQCLALEYDLGTLRSTSHVSEGNAAGFRLLTSKGSYFAKAEAADPALLRLYHAAADVLNKQGVRQAGLLATKDGMFISHDGFVVYEWLPGATERELTNTQFDSHIAYLARYNAALSAVPLDESTVSIETLASCDNPWRKAASLDYLLGTFQESLERISLSSGTRKIAANALAVLAGLRANHTKLPKQLIHSDIGPGNILFERGAVVAIIDFTAAYDSHLYSLCVSLFWHCIFPKPGDLPMERIRRALVLYDANHDLTGIENKCFFGLLVKAIAFRLFARLIANQEGGRFSKESIEYMALCAKSVLDARKELETASTNAGES